MFLLYVAGFVLATNFFISKLQDFERYLASTLGLSETVQGGLSQVLWEKGHYQDMLSKMTRDPDLARTLVRTPPLALIYGWMAYLLTPVLVMLSCSSRIAEDVYHGSIRFVAFRSSRLSWVLGKYVGQAMLILFALILSAIGAWILSRFRLSFASNAETVAALWIMTWKLWLYSISYVGLAMLVSQLVKSPNVATSLGFGLLIVISIVYGVAHHFAEHRGGALWETLVMILPADHGTDIMWQSWSGDGWSACLFLLSLSLSYLLCGYAFFARKDI